MRKITAVVAAALLALTLAACDNEDVAELQAANEELASEVSNLRSELDTLNTEWGDFQEDWTFFQENNELEFGGE